MSTIGNQSMGFEVGNLNVSLDGVTTGLVAGDIGNAFGVPPQSGRMLLPYNWTWSILQRGTTFATIQVDLEGSIDQVNWFQLDSDTAVAAFALRHVVYKPVRFIRAHLVAATGGDGTSNVVVGITA